MKTIKNKIEKALNEGYTDGYTDATKNAQKEFDETLKNIIDEIEKFFLGDNNMIISKKISNEVKQIIQKHGGKQ